MVSKYYLGANSKDGFISLYSEFPPDKGFLHIIKGGPGNGKSSFMRKIGREAEMRNMDVEYVLCSGDSSSLDGVYIPELAQAWVDGTAPHVIETDIFAVNSCYEDLGRFCSRLDSRQGAIATSLFHSYKSHYSRSYDALSKEIVTEYCEKTSAAALKKTVDICSALPIGNGKGTVKKRYLSAIGSLGHTHLSDEIVNRCSNIMCLNCSIFDAQKSFECIISYARDHSQDIIICLSPLYNGLTEGIILPNISTAFLMSSYAIKNANTYFSDLNFSMHDICNDAKEEFALAKSEHDALEALYRPYIDFQSLTAYTDTVISTLFA